MNYAHLASTRAILICTTILLFVSCTLDESKFSAPGKTIDSGPPKHIVASKSVRDLLLACPSYMGIEDSDVQGKRELLRTLEAIAAFDDQAIRYGIILALNESYTGQKYVSDSVFLANRFLFDVPEWVAFNGNGYGGWVGRPFDKENNRINLIWPFSYDKDHSLQLTEHLHGYNGPPYDGVAEFDYFHASFPRRKH